MIYIELGGSRSATLDVSGSPAVVDAVNFLERELDWPNIDLDTVVTLVASGALPDGGSMVIQVVKIVAGAPGAVAVADPTPIASAAFTEHEITVPREAAKTKYRLRATVTGADGLAAFLIGGFQLTGDLETVDSPCAALQTAVVNRALGYIGVTDQLDDMLTSTRVEGEQARLHIVPSIDEVLRAFDWPFATAYVDLAWVAGTATAPVNKDWTFSYRLPDDCVKLRRLVRPGIGREHDRTPIKFRRAGRDVDGDLVFSSYADPESDDPDAPTVHAEYTARPNCAVEAGDALFNEALSWLLAHKFAPGVARNKVTAAECYGKFLSCVSRAEVAAANEEEAAGDPRPDASWIADR